MSRRSVAWFVCAMALATPAGAQTSPPALAKGSSTAGISGVIFDSLTNAPLVGATVLVSGVSQIAVTSVSGRFAIDSVPVGSHTVTFSTPALDSLGLFALGGQVFVIPGTTVDVEFSTPSFATMWRSLCPNARATQGDSGIVYGSIVNAENELRLQGARVVFAWNDINAGASDVNVSRPVLVAQSDSVGNYYACGLPSDMNLAVEVDAITMSSGETEVLLPASRIVRRDFLVSTDLWVSDSVRRSLLAAKEAANDPSENGRVASNKEPRALKRRGTATLRGEVRNSSGELLSQVVVTVASADTSVRTNNEGRFVVGLLPAGSQAITARKLGSGELFASVDLRPGRETNVVFTLPPAVNRIAGVDVRADRATNRLLSAYEDRRANGLGIYLDQRDLQSKHDFVSAVQSLPSLIVRKQGINTTAYISHGVGGCTPVFYLDGRRVIFEMVSGYDPKDIIGIEYYSRGAIIPVEYQTFENCGAMLVWTKQLRR